MFVDRFGEAIIAVFAVLMCAVLTRQPREFGKQCPIGLLTLAEALHAHLLSILKHGDAIVTARFLFANQSVNRNGSADGGSGFY